MSKVQVHRSYSQKFFSIELLFKIKLSITQHDFDAQRKTCFKNVFLIIRMKYFHDSLNIVHSDLSY